MSVLTRILNQLDDGSLESLDKLMPLVYDELRKMASAKLLHEKAGQSLDATGLVHEAYLRLAGSTSFNSRRHFFGAAAEAMRRILIDRARSRNASKRGAGMTKVSLDPCHLQQNLIDDEKIESLNSALEKFERVDPEKAELIKMRYFIGLTIRESAEILGISTATADRNWAYAKVWLQTEVESLD